MSRRKKNVEKPTYLEDEYYVEKILDHNYKNGEKYYL